MTNPTNEHREQARVIVRRYLDDRINDHQLESEIASALSSRDAEIRQVLEGLASKVYVSFKGQYCWCRRAGLATRPEGDSHDLHCQRTRDFYAKLQPKESSDVT